MWSNFTVYGLPERADTPRVSLHIMSSVRKLTIKRGLRSPFSRKSSKKDRDNNEKGKDYDDDVATTDSQKGGAGGGGSVANGQNLRSSSSRSRSKWPFKSKSTKQRSGVTINSNGKTEVKEAVAELGHGVLSDATNINSSTSGNVNNTTDHEPGSSVGKCSDLGPNHHHHHHHKEEPMHDSVYAKTDQKNSYASSDNNKCDYEQYVTPVRRRSHEDGGGDDTTCAADGAENNSSSFHICAKSDVRGRGDSNTSAAVEVGPSSSSNALKARTPDSEDSSCGIEDYVKSGLNDAEPPSVATTTMDHPVAVDDDTPPSPSGSGGGGAPKLPPKPPSLRGRRISQTSAKTDFIEEDELPPRPPARMKNRTMGRDPNPPHLRGIPIADENNGGQYETVQFDYPARRGGGLASELAKLPRQPWYWGPLTQEEAEEKLKQRADGSFLVRDSSDERYLLSLSFKSHGRTLHTRIEYRNGLFSLNDSEGHASIVELVELAVRESRSGVYGYMRDSLGLQSYPAQLKNWVSRFTEVRELQHLCRFVIREVYPRHHIQRLPLPKKIKSYILENQY